MDTVLYYLPGNGDVPGLQPHLVTGGKPRKTGDEPGAAAVAASGEASRGRGRASGVADDDTGLDRTAHHLRVGRHYDACEFLVRGRGSARYVGNRTDALEQRKLRRRIGWRCAASQHGDREGQYQYTHRNPIMITTPPAPAYGLRLIALVSVE